jgi:hypothetical protein
MTAQDFDSPKKLNNITKSLKTRLHDFWYGWVMVIFKLIVSASSY